MVIDSWVPHEDPMLTRQDWCILRFVIRHAFVLAIAAALCKASVSNADVLSRGAFLVINSRASVLLLTTGSLGCCVLMLECRVSSRC